MYKLVITSGKGPSRKVTTKQFWMTQVGLHQAEEEFAKAQHRPDVMKLMLWRQDINGTFELERWTRDDG